MDAYLAHIKPLKNSCGADELQNDFIIYAD